MSDLIGASFVRASDPAPAWIELGQGGLAAIMSAQPALSAACTDGHIRLSLERALRPGREKPVAATEGFPIGLAMANCALPDNIVNDKDKGDHMEVIYL